MRAPKCWRIGWVSHVEGDIHDCTQDIIGKLLAGPLLSDEGVWKHIDHAIVVVSGTRDLGLSDVQEMVGALKDRMPVNIPIATSAILDDDNHDKVRVTVLLAMTMPIQIAAPAEPAVQRPAPVRPKAVSQTASLSGKPKAAPVVPVETTPIVNARAENRGAPSPRKPVAAPRPKPAPVTAVAPEPVPGEEAGDRRDDHVTAVSPPSRKRCSSMARPRGRFEKTHETIHRGENLDQPTFRRRGLAIQV